MPEIIEVEVYRRLADQVVGRTISVVEAGDAWFLKRGLDQNQAIDALTGATVAETDRRGKLLLLGLGGDRPVLGLRFGMTGRLVLDGDAPIATLAYSSHRDDPAWDRFALGFTDGARLRISDPRRLGGVELDPDLSLLGPDAWSVTLGQLRAALGDSTAPLKARLLNQGALAGLGNLLVDETLWRAGLDPNRPARSVTGADLARLQRRIRSTIETLDERGGSHTGDLQAERHRGGVCPLDGVPLDRRAVGGRTTYSCPSHQR